MDFTIMGKVGSYIKQKNLFFAANYKIRTGQRVVDANGNLQFAKTNMFDEMNKAQKKSDSEISSARISSIKQKLMSGRKLTTEEMEYLREKDPSLYKKAKHAEQSREELKNDLKKAKTKNEARQVLTQALIKASAEASAELAAYKSGVSAGAVGISTAGYQAGSEVMGNISGMESISENSPSLLQVNAEISADGEEMTGAAAEVAKLEIKSNQETAENLQQANSEIANAQQSENNVDENNNSSKKTTADDILEKFIMTVRALEDEWYQFTKSKKYDELPDDYFDEKNSKKTNRKVLDAISAYRTAMINR